MIFKLIFICDLLFAHEDEKWTELRAPCEERIEALEELKAFLQAHENLGSWINQKDKLMGVLGPIATEPGMLVNQMQQVQVNYGLL